MAEKQIPDQILDILACPTCKADLKLDKENSELICEKCGENFPIEDGIPILMPKES